MDPTLYQKIILTALELSSVPLLQDVLLKNLVGHKTLLLELPPQFKQGPMLAEALKNLREVLEILKIHPKAPYPIYILADKNSYEGFFPLLKSEKNVPKHFHSSREGADFKEKTTLNKLAIENQKLKNMDIEEYREKMKQIKEKEKRLYYLSRETQFYLEILKEYKQHNSKIKNS